MLPLEPSFALSSQHIIDTVGRPSDKCIESFVIMHSESLQYGDSEIWVSEDSEDCRDYRKYCAGRLQRGGLQNFDS